MKKRKILSALLAAAMTCAMCLSAGAVDVSPCIYDLEKESTHKTVSAGSCSYDCYTTLYYGNASKGCLWAVEKNKKDAQAALKTYLYENDNLVEEAGWSTSSSYIHLLDTKKRAVSGDIRVEGDYRFYHDNGDYTSGSAPVVRYSTSRSAAERMAVTSYPTNAKGETYGSYLDRNTVGQAPDLIAAIGENGVKGYIRLNDIAPELFTLEEIHKTLDGNILCMGIVSTITADYISKLFFGQNTVFHYTTADIPLKSYWILLLLGIVLGLAGVGYNALMLLGQKWIGKIKAPVRMMLVFVCSGVLGLFVPQLLGGGHTMVTLLLQEHPTIKILILLLLGKFLFSLLSFASGAPGGIFFPLLILGTYLGAIYAEAAIAWFGLAPELWQELVVVSMAGFFAAIVRAPLTGIILVFEMTGNLDSLLPLAVVSLTSYTLADLLGSTPIYTALLENLLRPEDKAAARRNRPGEKVLKTYVIPLGSALDGKCIKDIDWGRHCLIVSIERGDTAVTPKGDTTLHAGDTLVVMVSQRRFARDNDRLETLIAPKS